jgi:hypothetical protein
MRWQIKPAVLTSAIADHDPAAAKRAFNAMMEMTRFNYSAIEAALSGSMAMSVVGELAAKQLRLPDS